MPLRDLYYVVEELRKIAPPSRLHRTTKVEIPTPRFVVFYNGVAKQPDRQVYKLSELFSRKDEKPELELTVTVININRECNEELLERCESLRGYVAFVEKARNKKAAGIKLERAVSQAVEECISEDILSEFFVKHKKEIVEMGIYEFDQEVYDQVLREDGEAIGFERGKKEGIEIGIRIHKEISAGKTDNKVIAESIGCTLEEVEKIRKQFEI